MISVVVGGFCLMVLLPFLNGRRKTYRSLEQFAVSKKNFGVLQLAAGLSTTYIGGAAVVNLSSLAYTYGNYAFADVIPTCLALILSGLLLVRVIYNRKGFSLGSFIASENKSLRLLTGILSTTTYLLITAAQIMALTQILHPYLGSHSWLVSVASVVLIGSYIICFGYWAVTFTDVIQFFLILFGFVGFVLLGHQFASGISSTTTAIPFQAMNQDQALVLALPLFFIPASQDLHTRVHSSQSIISAKAGAIIAGIVYFCFGSLSIMIGKHLALQGIQLDQPDQAISFYLFHQFGNWSIIPIIAIVAIIVSTLDSVLFAATHSFASDTLSPLFKNQNRPQLWIARTACITVMSGAILLSLFADRIFHVIISALTIYAGVILPMILAKLLKVSESFIAITGFCFLLIISSVEIMNLEIPYRFVLFLLIHAAILFSYKIISTIWPSQNV